jgi:hypothetical protein
LCFSLRSFLLSHKRKRPFPIKDPFENKTDTSIGTLGTLFVYF